MRSTDASSSPPRLDGSLEAALTRSLRTRWRSLFRRDGPRSASPFAAVDIAPLVFFRLAFGLIMLWEVWRYFEGGRIKAYWIDPQFNFPYQGFEWVTPLPGVGMYVLWAALGVFSLFITVGFWYRASMALFALGFTYQFLLEGARYLNHFYLLCLISFLMVFVPAHRALAVDAWRRPRLRSSTAPAWSLWLLRAQVGIAYFYGGLAKLNVDWLHGEPMRTWLGKRDHYPVLGHLVHNEWTVAFFSYGGLIFDLTIVPLLLWRRTRVPAFVGAVFFHCMNAWMFNIGIFPWFMLPATMLFFEPGWHRRALGWLGLRRWLGEAPGATAAAPATSGATTGAGASGGAGDTAPTRSTNPHEPSPTGRRWILGLIGAYLTIQALVPLRHHLYPGDVSWTEEGHRFAWHMMLRNKRADAKFYVTDPATKHTWIVDPGHHLTPWQEKKMAGRPDMLLQFAHHLADLAAQDGHPDVEVRVRALASLNRREPQLLIDPDVDLTKEELSLAASDWILPLEKSLRVPWGE